MLCLHDTNNREICTNRCPERTECKKQKTPFLIEAVDRLADEANLIDFGNLKTISFKLYCVSPQVFINGVVDVKNENDELFLS
jgi:hypothetical protein